MNCYAFKIMFCCLPEHKAEEIPQTHGRLELRITWQKCEIEFRLLHKKIKNNKTKSLSYILCE